MKNSKIFEIIKKGGQAICFEIDGEQWISDGRAAYSLAGLPKFSKETLLCMLDKTENDTFPVMMNAPTVIGFNEELDRGEGFDVEIPSITIKWKKEEYILVKFDINQSFFVKLKYVKEFYKDYNYRFTVEKTAKGYFLAVYDGFIPCAAIMPSPIITTQLYNTLAEVYSCVDMRMKKDALETVFGDSVGEENILGREEHYSLEIEQEEI